MTSNLQSDDLVHHEDSISDIVNGLNETLESSNFFDSTWQKNKIVLRNQFTQLQLDQIFPLDLFDMLLTSGGIVSPHLDIVLGGKKMPAPMLQSPSPGTNVKYLIDKLDGGATLRLPHIEQHMNPLADFCRDFERIIGMPIRANLYLTPAFSQGFKPHYDLDDIFVIQVLGNKTWTLHPDYSNQVSLPNREQDFNENIHKPQGVPYEELLESGDLLYLPRGFMHEARTEEKLSIHITFAVIGMTCADVIHRMIDLAALNDERLRFRYGVNATSTDHKNSEQISTISRHINDICPSFLNRSLLVETIDRMRNTLLNHRNPDMRGHLLDRLVRSTETER